MSALGTATGFLRHIVAVVSIAALSPLALAQGGTPGTSPLEALKRVLSMLREGRLAIESLFEYSALSAEVLEQSLSHLRSMPTDRWTVDSPDDHVWAEIQATLQQKPGRTPISLGQWVAKGRRRPGGSQLARSEICVFRGHDFRWEAHETLQGGDSDGKPLKRVRVRRGSEIIAWETISGESHRTDRIRVTEEDSGFEGSLVKYDSWAKQVSTLLEIADAQGRVSVHADPLTFDADMRKPSDLRRISGGHPLGFYEIPGVVTCRASVDSSLLTVDLLWRDTLGRPLCRDTGTWDLAKGPFPTRLLQTSFAPGTEYVITKFSMSSDRLAPASSTADEIAWEPFAGERVVDSRFGNSVSYRVGEDGSLPSDASILVESERTASIFRGGGAPSQVAALRSLPKEEPVESAPVAPQALRVLNDTLDLGPQLVGSRHRLEFTLQNTTDQAIIIGSIRTDCGCTEILAEHNVAAGQEFAAFNHTIAPGETRRMAFSQEVQSLGRQEHVIQIAIVEPEEDVLKLNVRFEGAPALKVLPELLDLGRITAGEVASATVYLLDNGCVPAGELPTCHLEGFSVSSAWSRESEEVWVGHLQIAPVDPTRFGALQGYLDVKSTGCPNAFGRTQMNVEVVPAGEVDRWPACTVVVMGESDVETAQLDFPDLELSSFRTSPGRMPTGIECGLAPASPGERFEIRVDHGSSMLRELFHFSAYIQTRIGTVEVAVYVLPRVAGDNQVPPSAPADSQPEGRLHTKAAGESQRNK